MNADREEDFMYECPNCGGQLRFDIKKQKLACDSCNAEFEPDTDLMQESAGKSSEYGAQVFECPNCGARMITTNVNAVSFCSYCGTSAVIPGRLTNEKKPNYILPFKKTKEDCIEEYRKKTRRSIFAPKEFRDSAFLDTFRGIYMPYWIYDYKFDHDASIPVCNSYRSGDYIMTDHYDLHTQLDAEYDGIAYDASAAFNDVTSNGILPWDESELKPFSPGYLCGFYADTADVPRRIYQNDATSVAVDSVYEKVGNASRYSLEDDPGVKRKVTQLGGCQTRSGRALLPVWFLTWRRKGRVAYAVMNGQSGQLTADLPVDMKRYTIGSLLLAVPLFLLFQMNTITSYSLLCIAQILAVAAAFIFFFEQKDIYIWETRRQDKGYMYLTGQKAETERKKHKKLKKRRGSLLTTLLLIYLFLTFGIAFISAAAGFVSSAMTDNTAPAVISVIAIICFIVLYFRMKKGKDSTHYNPRCLIFNFITSLIAAVISILHPPYDFLYYISAVLCLIAVAYTTIELIRAYNRLATRPIPTLFETGSGGVDSDKTEPEHENTENGQDTSKDSVILSAVLAGVLAAAAVFGGPEAAQAYSGDVVYTDESNGNQVVIDDEADLLSSSEEEKLQDDMEPITEYGNVAFVSVYASESTSTSAEDAYRDYFQYDSGMLFMIDMNHRNIWIFSDGDVYKVITKSYANSITDNVYRYASSGDYYTCAAKAYEQAATLLDGGKISQPMRYICAALLAIIAALLLNYLIVRLTTRKNISEKRVLGSARVSFRMSEPQYQFIKRTEVYDPPVSADSGGSSGGGGGGGGSSGGGGGHGF